MVKAENFNTQLLEKGLLSSSWHGVAADNDVLFTLVFKANTKDIISNLIQLTSEVTPAEAYNQAGITKALALQFSPSNSPLSFNLEQNAPNPFNGQTWIGFTLPKAMSATLKIRNMQGQILKTITKYFAEGRQQIRLTAEELGATGLFYYQLEAEGQIEGKKMVVLE